MTDLFEAPKLAEKNTPRFYFAKNAVLGGVMFLFAYLSTSSLLPWGIHL